MPRRIDKPGDVRYLTFSCYRRLPLFSNDRIKDAFAAHLARCRDDMAFRLYAWVVMPEHVHLLVFPDVSQCPMAVLLRSLKEPFARDVLRRWRRLDARILTRVTDPRGQVRFWQRGGGYDRNIRSETDLAEKMEYIHTNPVQRGLVKRPDEWKWSSARSFTRGYEETIPIDRR